MAITVATSDSMNWWHFIESSHLATLKIIWGNNKQCIAVLLEFMIMALIESIDLE